MRMSFLKVGVAFAALAISGQAFAADAIEAPPEPPVSAAPIELAPVATWSGFYGGAALGYTWGTFDSTAGNINANGISGLGFVGYNFQDGPVVYGVEGDLGYSDAKQSFGAATLNQRIFGSARGRVGYAFDPVMIYGTAGLAATQAKLTNGAATDTNTLLGWTVGAGVDALLTENVFGRLEYRYSDYASKNFVAGPTTISSGFSDHSVRAGVGLKF